MQTKMKELVVYDTNIFVSYLFPLKKVTAVRTVVDRMFDGYTIPVFSDEIMAEYERVLHYDKFGFSDDSIRGLLDVIFDTGRYVIPTATRVLFRDESDKCFYDAAITAHADWLITGNRKHFPDDSFIVTAAQYLAHTGER